MYWFLKSKMFHFYIYWKRRNFIFLQFLLMLKVFFFPLFLLFFCSLSWTQVPIGSLLKNPSNSLKNANGRTSSIMEEMRQNGLIIVFSCNTCPFVVGSKHFPGWENQYNDLFDISMKNNIGFVLINSNEAKRDGDDSFEKMKVHAKENEYKMSYLLDEKSSLANELMAKTTPHVYFYNAKFELIYSGSIDNIWDGKRKKENYYLKDAINNHVNLKKIKPANTPPKGCSIKREKP